MNDQAFAEKYAAALADQRDEKDYHFRNDPYSPIPWEKRESFKGLSYFPPNLELRLTIPLEREAPEPIQFQTTTGTMRHYDRIGTLAFTVEGEDVTLALYEAEPGEFFLPFRDATSGTESYLFRFLRLPAPDDDGRVELDLNRAYLPPCAFSDHYLCVFPPPRNRWTVPVRTGELVVR